MKPVFSWSYISVIEVAGVAAFGILAVVQGQEKKRNVMTEAVQTRNESEIEQRNIRDSRYSAISSTQVEGGKVTYQIAIDEGGSEEATEVFRIILVSKIMEVWQPVPFVLGETREVLVEFTLFSPPVPKGSGERRIASILKNSRIIESSGNDYFDREATRTIARLTKLPPLPDYVKDELMVVTCLFSYRGEVTQER